MDTDTSAEIATRITASLQDGPYATRSLEKLSGGTANFVYRVLLSKPLEDGTKTVVVKHTEGFVALNPTFKIAENRCVRPKLTSKTTCLLGLDTSTHSW